MHTMIRWHVAALSTFALLKERAIEDRERGEVTSQTFMIAAMVGIAVVVAGVIAAYVTNRLTPEVRNPSVLPTP